MAKIAICIPMRETIYTTFFDNFLKTLFDTSKNHVIALNLSVRFPLQKARQELMENALKSDPDYILMIDSDMILPDGIVDKLIGMDVDVASALYFAKNPPYMPIIRFKKENENYYESRAVSLNERVEVDAAGLGCMLIKAGVVKKLLEKEKKIFDMTEREVRGQKIPIGEDVYFCELLKKHGHKIFVNTGIICGHIGMDIITQDQYLFVLNNAIKQMEKEVAKEQRKE